MNSSSCRYLGRSRLLAWVAGAGLAMLASHAGAVVSQSGDTTTQAGARIVTAQWQSYDLRFHYFGFTTYYSCSGLEDRLEQLLMEMGADRDVRVIASGCFGFHDVSKTLSARIQVRMPALQGTSQDASFPAVSKSVLLRSSRYGDMGAGDCELLEQVRDQLLPALKLQLVKDDLSCMPGQASLRGYTLQVMALIPEKPAKP